jgi:hypothetical protein
MNNFKPLWKFTGNSGARSNPTGNFTFVNKDGGGVRVHSIDIFGSNFSFMYKVHQVCSLISGSRMSVAEGWVQVAATFDYSSNIMKFTKMELRLYCNPPSSLKNNSNFLAFGIQAGSGNQPMAKWMRFIAWVVPAHRPKLESHEL